jgi:hypothetical protein
MKKTIMMSLVAILLVQVSQAQMTLKMKGEGEHRLSLVFTPQQYFNGINISGEGLPQVLHTQNTFGYKMGLDYQRTTRYGLIFGGGIYFGSQKNTIDVVYGSDRSWFDPHADHPEQLVGRDIIKKNYAFTSKYAALQLKAGYSFKLPASWGKGWRLETTLGLTSRFYLNSPHYGPSSLYLDTKWDMMYEKGGVNYLSAFASEYGHWSYSRDFTFAETFEGYIGISKGVNLGWLRNFSLGIEVGKNFFHKGRSAYLNNKVMNFYGQQIAHNTYESKNLSLGIKVAVGLWPNIESRR